MKKILILLLFFFSTQGFTASNSKSSVQESTSSGNWFPTNNDGFAMYSPSLAKKSKLLREKSFTHNNFVFTDIDNDGITDFLLITNPKRPGVVWDEYGPGCDTSIGACYTKEGSITVIKVDKIKYFDSFRYTGVDVTGLLYSDNPIEMNGTETTDIHLADFNGDGKVDVFATDGGSINMDKTGKNDVYFLSNEKDNGWTESTATHVTGEWCCVTKWSKGHGVKEGKGLTNFSHGGTVGDIDGDGDIDIVVTSTAWHGWEETKSKKTQNGFIYCYENQGDGHMKVRQCGNQWGKTAELGDIDNDGDLDLVWGSKSYAGIKFHKRFDYTPGCMRNNCNGTFNGILLNDGTGNFYERGFEFEDKVLNSSGVPYQSVPTIGVVDLDNDGDLDVIRNHVGWAYAGSSITIEENIGNGQFKTVFNHELCASPKTRKEWPTQEGTQWTCWISDFNFGDFNKDGLVDIYLDGHDAKKSDVIDDGTIYMSNDKFTYNIVKTTDKDYPLEDIQIKKEPEPKFGSKKISSKSEQEVKDEKGGLASELDSLIIK